MEILTGSVIHKVIYNSSSSLPIIDIKDFETLKCVGAGSYGKVYLVNHIPHNTKYAMKVILKDTISKLGCLKYINNEKDIMTKIEHPFIVTLRYAFQSKTKLYLVMDYLPGGELFLHLKKQGTLFELEAKTYISEIILAVNHLHDLNIIHRDLKPENILLQVDSHLALTDFGLARYVEGEDASSLCGTNLYMAPEVIKGGKYGKAVDWWSVGALLYEMLVGDPPFQGKNTNMLYKNIVDSRLKFPPFLTSDCTRLLKSFLLKDPSKRLGSEPIGGFQSIKKQPFFKKLDWNKLLRKEIDPPFKFHILSDDVKFCDPKALNSQVPIFMSPRLSSVSTEFNDFDFIHPDLIPPMFLDDKSNEQFVESNSSDSCDLNISLEVPKTFCANNTFSRLDEYSNFDLPQSLDIAVKASNINDICNTSLRNALNSDINKSNDHNSINNSIIDFCTIGRTDDNINLIQDTFNTNQPNESLVVNTDYTSNIVTTNNNNSSSNTPLLSDVSSLCDPTLSVNSKVSQNSGKRSITQSLRKRHNSSDDSDEIKITFHNKNVKSGQHSRTPSSQMSDHIPTDKIDKVQQTFPVINNQSKKLYDCHIEFLNGNNIQPICVDECDSKWGDNYHINDMTIELALKPSAMENTCM